NAVAATGVLPTFATVTVQAVVAPTLIVVGLHVVSTGMPFCQRTKMMGKCRKRVPPSSTSTTHPPRKLLTGTVAALITMSRLADPCGWNVNLAGTEMLMSESATTYTDHDAGVSSRFSSVRRIVMTPGIAGTYTLG